MSATVPPPGISEGDWEQTPPSVRAVLSQAAPSPGLRALSERLGAVLAPEEILPLIVETLARELRLPSVSITLRRADTETFELAAQCDVGLAASEPYVFPLLHQMEIVGQLIVAPRPSGDPLLSEEQALLMSIAQRAGTAAYIVGLTSDLRRTRERLVLAREEERRRLRRDLHDSIGPTLAALNLKVGTLRRLVQRDPAAAEQVMIELREQIRTVITDIRRVVYNLRPPALDELGMVPAIREQAAQFSMEGFEVTVEAPEHLPPLPAAVEVAAYRIVLEALTNVARHAQARRCRIVLALGSALEVEVTDDGIGLPLRPQGGVGLASMRERAAELGGVCAIEPALHGGTRVWARLPLEWIDA